MLIKTILFIILFFVLFQINGNAKIDESDKETKNTVSLQVSNPYKFDAEIEVKCDWDGKEYLFYRKLFFRGKEVTTIVMPSNIRKCEMWPHINLW
jgi:hypothetical protein